MRDRYQNGQDLKMKAGGRANSQPVVERDYKKTQCDILLHPKNDVLYNPSS
jgi:hypothetical protein